MSSTLRRESASADRGGLEKAEGRLVGITKDRNSSGAGDVQRPQQHDPPECLGAASGRVDIVRGQVADPMAGRLAFDPGSARSAWLQFDGTRRCGLGFTANDVLVRALRTGGLPDVVVIEKVESFGMAVGAEVFGTVRWAGASPGPPTVSRSSTSRDGR